MAVRGGQGLPALGRGQTRSPLLAPWGGSCSPTGLLPGSWGSLALRKLIQPLRGHTSGPGPSLLIRDRQDPAAAGLGRRGDVRLPPAPGWVWWGQAMLPAKSGAWGRPGSTGRFRSQRKGWWGEVGPDPPHPGRHRPVRSLPGAGLAPHQPSSPPVAWKGGPCWCRQGLC